MFCRLWLTAEYENQKTYPFISKTFYDFWRIIWHDKGSFCPCLCSMSQNLENTVTCLPTKTWFGLITGLLTREHNLCSVSEDVLNKVAFCTKDFGYQTHNREKAKFFLGGGMGTHQLLYSGACCCFLSKLPA